MKSLVIAEKPSVATDLAKVLKVPKATSDYFENEKWVISSSIGHVVRLVDPDDIDPKFKRWTLKDLPIDPVKFDGTASPDILKAVISERNNGDRYKLLKKLLNRPDVGTVVNACEGESKLRTVPLTAPRYPPEIRRSPARTVTDERRVSRAAHDVTSAMLPMSATTGSTRVSIANGTASAVCASWPAHA